MIFLVTGLKRSGKGEVSNFIQNHLSHLGKKTLQTSFGKELREHLRILNPIVYGHVKWNNAIQEFGYEEAKTKFPEMRRIMQTYGTEVIRNKVDPNYWANSVIKEIERFYKAETIGHYQCAVIVNDCRFLNEWKEIDISGFKSILVQVLRNNIENDGHASEDQGWVAEVPRIVIENNGSLEDLRKKVEDLLNTIYLIPYLHPPSTTR